VLRSNLFPEDCFKEKKLTGVTIKTLLAKTVETRMLVEWMERGIFDALEKKVRSCIVVLAGS
jgi:hypothetical protein